MNLTAHLGDTRTFTIPLRWGNRPFVPGSEWGLVFTVKSDPATQADAERLFQKSGPGTMAGLEASGSTATIFMVRADTFREEGFNESEDPEFQADPGTYHWDIQASHTGSGEVRTVASGTLVLTRDVTHLSSPSGVVYTTHDPVFQGPTGPAGSNGQDGAGIITSPTPPEDTTVIWRDSIDGSLNVWDGTYWVTDSVVVSSGEGSITPDPPSEDTPPDGTYFLDESSNYFADPDSVLFADPV